MAPNSESIRFLESTINLRKAIKRVTGRTPSAEIARDVSACLQQGRLFFEAAATSPLQIQPLQLYYGMVGFAKAIVLARKASSISTLVQSHGLSEASDDNTTIAAMRIKFQEKGVFQQFNDSIAALATVNYYDGSMRHKVSKPFDSASALAGSDSTLQELLRRIPSLQRSIRRTFDIDPLSWSIDISYQNGLVDLRLDDPILFSGKDGLRDMIAKWRVNFPWLNDWCFAEATLAWNQSVLIFRNREKPPTGELTDDNLVQTEDVFVGKTNNERGIFWLDILPPVAGGLANTHLSTISPLNGVALSEFTLQFSVAFLLSSLVRYRPHVWQHALSHSDTQNRAADDAALSLIETFMQATLNEFPVMVREAIDPSS